LIADNRVPARGQPATLGGIAAAHVDRCKHAGLVLAVAVIVY
jgi:hypothetical protein